MQQASKRPGAKRRSWASGIVAFVALSLAGIGVGMEAHAELPGVKDPVELDGYEIEIERIAAELAALEPLEVPEGYEFGKPYTTLRPALLAAASSGYLVGPDNISESYGSGYHWIHPASDHGGHWLGAFDVDGEAEWCIDFDSISPQGGGTATTFEPQKIPGAVESSKKYQLASSAEMGYIIDKYMDKSSAQKMAAISTLVHLNYEIDGGRRWLDDLVEILEDDTRGELIASLARTMVSDAKENTREYKAQGSANPGSGLQDLTIDNLGIKRVSQGGSTSGTWIADVDVTLTITSGNAVFDPDRLPGGTIGEGGTVWKGTTIKGPLSVPIIAIETGVVESTARFSAPPALPSVNGKERGSTQSTIYLSSHSEPQAFDFQPVPRTLPFQPSLSSKVEDSYFDVPGVFRDRITVSVEEGKGTWVEVDGKAIPAVVTTDVYWMSSRPSASVAVPPGAEKIASITKTFAGPGFQIVEAPATRPGYYVAKSTFRVADQPEQYQQFFRGDATYDFGLIEETSTGQVSPYVTTKAQDRILLTGVATSDSVTIHLRGGAEWPSGFSVVASGTLYGPFDTPEERSENVPNDAPIEAQKQLTFTSDRQELVAQWTPTGPGFFTWVWTISAEEQVDPSLVEAFWQDEFFINEESTSVKVPTLKHESLAREFNVHADGRAFDTIKIEGFPASHPLWEGVEDQYWAPDKKEAKVTVYDAGVGTDWTSVGAQVPGSAKVHWEATVEASNGTFQIGYDDNDPITNFKAGHDYVFVYSFAGDDRVAPFTSAFDDIFERFHVPGPVSHLSVATQASGEVLVGEPLEDTALVMGDLDAYPNAYLVFRAYGPHDSQESPNCQTVPFFVSERIPVEGPGFYRSGSVSLELPGVVYWVETLYDADGDVLSEGKCGLPSETTQVVEPSLATEAADSGIVDVGESSIQTLTDTVCYSDVIPGRDYQIAGILMDKQTGSPLLDQEGKAITASTDVHPIEANGCVDVLFQSDPASLIGKTTVVFESLLFEGREISVHADLEDARQTVAFPPAEPPAEEPPAEEPPAEEPPGEEPPGEEPPGEEPPAEDTPPLAQTGADGVVLVGSMAVVLLVSGLSIALAHRFRVKEM